MDSIASFKIPAFESKFIVDVQNLLGDETMVPFCFDTGANVSLIGLNTVCGNNQSDWGILKTIVEKHVARKKIVPFMAKTVAMEEMMLFPCKSEKVSVAGTQETTFYFHIFLGRIGVALLGFDYINGCSFTHEIGKSIFVNAVNNKMNAALYPKNVLNFHDIMKEFRKKKND